MPPRTRYPCPWCGRERVARNDPCPVCDGQPQQDVCGRGHIPGVPQYKCAECGWEPPGDHPVPRWNQRFCGRCGTEMMLWQDRSPVSQCRGCDKIIDYGEEYCWHCWQAWRSYQEGRRHFERRVVKSSWTHPEGSSWGSSWEHQGTETEAMLSQPEHWAAMPPPTSL